MYSEEIEIHTGHNAVVYDLSREIEGFLDGADAKDGLLHVWVPHATAGLAILETGAGSDDDLLMALDELLPRDGRWQHSHGSHGHGRDHVLPALAAPHATIPVIGGVPALGTWQSVCLVDTNLDNPVRRVRFSLLVG